MEQVSLLDLLIGRLKKAYGENRVPLLSSVIAGLCAHMYMLANKLPNHDEIESIFGKGATVTSGRWGLELIKPLFPDCSMPWIYGLISILLISAAVCLMVRLLDIRRKSTQALIGALVLTFPSLTGTFCFMFTSSSYALAFLLSVLAVYEFQRRSTGGYALGAVCIVLCLSVYQAYIAISASLFVLLMIKLCLEAEKSPLEIVLYGVKALLMMLAALAVYYAVTLLVLKFSAEGFNSYVLENVNTASIPTRIKMAYESFRDVFTYRNFYLISSETSRYLHIALLALTLAGIALLAARTRKPLTAVLLAVLVLLLPLSINCMYLMMAPASIHTLVVYSFVCVYLLAALVTERLHGRAGFAARDAMSLIMAAAVLSNVYFANMSYLKLQLQYESASSFYTALIAQIKSTEGFDADCSLALVGYQDNMLYIPPELDTELLMGPAHDLINIYSRENFFRLYLGFDIPFAAPELLESIETDPEFEAMAEYPFYGSVKRIGDCIVVKLG